ncbi:MAG TPA: RsmE family RNA methyltransferase [Bacteroidales bacterium]|nr:RsmE family RNA methyltransferase [Bacteroidales bacterium]HRZ49904.1 RsmE family RNA methyltransferase [Bacteroidales bacterium]
MQLFYHPEIPVQGAFTLDAAESKHLVKVLRKRIGDEIPVTNGKGFLYRCRILTDTITACRLEVLESEPGKDVQKASLHLAISPVKNPSRFEWFLEKATETGVAEITPLICQRTEKQSIKQERLVNLLVSAMKQSGRTLLPALNPPTPFVELLRQKRDNPAHIAWCGAKDLPFLGKVLAPGTDALILIGPEGDFTPQEAEMAINHHFLPVSLANATLRTETAGLVAAMVFNVVNADL